MLLTYGLGLVFTLHTHKHFFTGHAGDGGGEGGARRIVVTVTQPCGPWREHRIHRLDE